MRQVTALLTYQLFVHHAISDIVLQMIVTEIGLLLVLKPFLLWDTWIILGLLMIDFVSLLLLKDDVIVIAVVVVVRSRTLMLFRILIKV